MIDNFYKIVDLLEFSSIDNFYILQIIQNKKGNNELNKSSIVRYTYFIDSKENFHLISNEVKDLCNVFKAQAYININPYSYKKASVQALKSLVDIIINNDYQSAKNSYITACSKLNNKINKKWIVDINEKLNISSIVDIMTYINNECTPNGKKIIDVITTNNGYHIITYPFDKSKFKYKYNYDIHTNNSTLLYMV